MRRHARRARRARRAGFTLVETMVALVVTGVVALAAYAALDAGAATRRRIDGPLRAREHAVVARALLEDALRHAVDAGGATPAPAFVALAPDPRSGGDALDFVTRGVTEPLGASPRWRVRVAPPAGGGDVVLVADPLDGPGPTLRTSLAGVRAVRVLTPGPGGWRPAGLAIEDHGGDPSRVPAVLRVEFVAASDGAGIPLAPIVARTDGVAP